MEKQFLFRSFDNSGSNVALLRFISRDNNTPNSKDPLLPTFMAEGASHHFWTHEVKDTDGPFVNNAREYIYKTVKNWLSGAAKSDCDEIGALPRETA